MQETPNSLPGTRDLLPEEIARWQFVEGRGRIFDQYGFLEIRTPIIEPTELSVGCGNCRPQYIELLRLALQKYLTYL